MMKLPSVVFWETYTLLTLLINDSVNTSLFADLASFAVAIAAAHLAALPATDQHTFGLKRTESLAALLSMISLALVSIYLAVEAIRRLVRRDSDVDGKLMSGVAGIGVLVNVALILILGVDNHVHLPGAHDHAHDHDHGCSSDNDGHSHGHDHHGTEKHDHDHSHDNHGQSTTSTNHEHSHDHREEAHSHEHTIHEHEHTSNNHNHDHHHEENEKLLAQQKKPSSYHALHSDELAPSGHSDNKKPIKNVNLQAAYLHVFGDLMQSLGVLIAGLAIWYNPKWTIVDPICTLFFCAIVFYSTLGVLRHSLSVLLQEMPPELSWKTIYNSIETVGGVQNVHDLHVWSISQGEPALAVHCSCDDATSPQDAMKQITERLNKQGIHHITIQIQQGNGDCITCGNTQFAGCDHVRLSQSGVSSTSPPGEAV